MLNVSEAVKTLYKSSNAPITLQLRIGNTTYTDHDVVAGSMSIIESLCSLETFDLSTVEKNELVFSLFNEEQEISDLVGQSVVASHIVTLPNNTTETVSLGTYTIVNAVKDGDYIFTCTCYDGMLAFDKIIDDWWNTDITFPITIKDLAESLFDELNLQYSLPSTFVNYDFEVSVRPTYFENIKASEVLGYIQEVAGGFFKVDRLGTVRFYGARQLTDGIGFGDNAVVVEYSYRQIFDDLNVADYDINKITALQIRGTEDDVGIVVGTGTNVFIIEGNPLLYNVTEDDNQIALNILNAIKDITYTPFSGDFIGLPYVEFGDCVHAVSYKNTEVTSPIFYRVLNSQRLSVDSFTTKGEKQRPVTKTLNRVIKVVNQKTHELVNTVETLSSTITQVETDLSGQIQTNTTAIQQNSREITIQAQRVGNCNYIQNSNFTSINGFDHGWTLQNASSGLQSAEVVSDADFTDANGKALKLTKLSVGSGTPVMTRYYQMYNFGGENFKGKTLYYLFDIKIISEALASNQLLAYVSYQVTGSTTWNSAVLSWINPSRGAGYKAQFRYSKVFTEDTYITNLAVYIPYPSTSGDYYGEWEVNNLCLLVLDSSDPVPAFGTWTDISKNDLISQINLSPTGLRINADKITVDTSSLDLTFGSAQSSITIQSTNADDGVWFDGNGKILFETEGEFRAKNLDPNNYLANQILMRSNLESQSERYNQISFMNLWNGITSNQIYANAFSDKTDFWFYNNRPGASINANNHYMGVTSTAYINRLYNYKFQTLSNNAAVTANYFILSSSATAEMAEIGNYALNSTYLANQVQLTANASLNGAVVRNYDMNNASYLANAVNLNSSSTYNGASLANNNGTGSVCNLLGLNHTRNSSNSASLVNYMLNGNSANGLSMVASSAGNLLSLTNFDDSNNIKTGLYMNTDGTFEITTITGGSQRITMNKNGNLDVVGNNVVYLGTTLPAGYISIKTGGVQKDCYWDSNGYLRGQ